MPPVRSGHRASSEGAAVSEAFCRSHLASHLCLTHDFVHQSFKQSFSAPIPVYWYRPLYPLPTGSTLLSLAPAIRDVKMDKNQSRGAHEASKSDQEHFFSAPRASKSAPRGFQEAFPAPSALMLRFGPRLGHVFVPQKGEGSAETCQHMLVQFT